MTVRAPSLLTVTVAGLALLAVANLSFRSLEPPGLSPLQVKQGPEFEHLVRGQGTTLEQRGLIYANLANVAAGARITAFPSSRLDDDAVRALVRAELVVSGTYDHVLDDAEAAALLRLPHDEGEFSRDQVDDPFVVIHPIDPPHATHFRAFEWGRTLVIVDDETRRRAARDGGVEP